MCAFKGGESRWLNLAHVDRLILCFGPNINTNMIHKIVQKAWIVRNFGRVCDFVQQHSIFSDDESLPFKANGGYNSEGADPPPIPLSPPPPFAPQDITSIIFNGLLKLTPSLKTRLGISPSSSI